MGGNTVHDLATLGGSSVLSCSAEREIAGTGELRISSRYRRCRERLNTQPMGSARNVQHQAHERAERVTMPRKVKWQGGRKSRHMCLI